MNPVWLDFVRCSKKSVMNLCVCMYVCVIIAKGNVQIEIDTFLMT